MITFTETCMYCDFVYRGLLPNCFHVDFRLKLVPLFCTLWSLPCYCKFVGAPTATKCKDKLFLLCIAFTPVE